MALCCEQTPGRWCIAFEVIADVFVVVSCVQLCCVETVHSCIAVRWCWVHGQSPLLQWCLVAGQDTGATRSLQPISSIFSHFQVSSHTFKYFSHFQVSSHTFKYLLTLSSIFSHFQVLLTLSSTSNTFKYLLTLSSIFSHFQVSSHTFKYFSHFQVSSHTFKYLLTLSSIF